MVASTSKSQEAETRLLSYVLKEDVPGYNPLAAKRIIRMVPAQLDPMMPPKHRHQKVLGNIRYHWINV